LVTLDVGCGDFKRGDIGVDKIKTSEVDVVADIEGTGLPFIDDAFDVVVSFQFIEHVSNPENVLLEMLMVSKSRVYLECPHRYGKYAQITHCAEGHKNVFNIQWFVKFAQKYGLKIRLETTFSSWFFLARPFNIKVELKKT
jgi:SAM-dependent methyltransferase